MQRGQKRKSCFLNVDKYTEIGESKYYDNNSFSVIYALKWWENKDLKLRMSKNNNKYRLERKKSSENTCKGFVW
jgi:hypothetical protein